MRLLQVLVVGLGLSFGHFAKAADQKLATVEVEVKGKTDNAKGIRTLFVIVYDSASKTPRPYGALKVDLKADPTGTVYKGDLTTGTTGNVTVMGESTTPKTIRIKARLDKDGSAGGDQPGDFSATVDNINVGEKGKEKEIVKITIDVL